MKCIDRIVAFCIAIVLIFPCMAIAVSAEIPLIENGDFSSDLSPWWGYNKTYGSVVLDGDNPVACLDLSGGLPDGIGMGAHFSQICTGIRGGGTYTLSLRVRGDIACETDAQNGFYAFFELYRSVGQVNSELVRGERGAGIRESTAAKWMYYTVSLATTEDIKTIKVYIFLQARGKVVFDDALLSLSDAPEPYSIKTSHAFHYTQNETGRAEVILNDFYKGTDDEARATADFVITDTATGETLTASKRGVAMTDGKITFLYPSSVLAVKERRYTLTITIYNKEETPVKTVTRGLYLYDRPTRITDKAEYIVDGEVITPVIGWTVDDYDVYPTLRAAGINVVTVGHGKTKIYNAETDTVDEAQIQYLRDNLAALEANDMYAIFMLCGSMKNAAHPDNLANTKKIVELFREEERIFGWFIEDEPFSSTVTEESIALLEKAYAEIRKIDKMHPVYLGENRISNLGEAVKYCDILQPHIYMNSPTAIEARTREAVEIAAAQGRKPVYPLIKAYCLAGETMPTGAQIRNYAYQTVLGGAQGFGYYSIEDAYENYDRYNPKRYLYNMEPNNPDAAGRETQWQAVAQMNAEYKEYLVPSVRGKTAVKTQNEEGTAEIWQFEDVYVLMPLETMGKITFVLRTDETLTLAVGDSENLAWRAMGYQITLPAWQPMVLRRQNPAIFMNGAEASTLQNGTARIEAGKLGGEAAVLVQLRAATGETIGVAVSEAGKDYCEIEVTGAAKTLEAFFWEKDTLKPLWGKETITRP